MRTAGTPKLEMLWELDAPGDVLRTRFGFDSADAAAEWVASVLSERWGQQVTSCERIVMSDSNALAWIVTPGGRMVAKWSIAAGRYDRLDALARLTTWLAGEGLPVSPPVPTSTGHIQVRIGSASLGLQHEIAGDLLDTSDPLQVRAAGAALSRLHHALADYPEAARFPAAAAPAADPATRISSWLDSAPQHIPTAARAALQRLVAVAPPNELPTQLVHGDYRSANVLCARQSVAAVIDFEEARFDHRIVELARAAVMLGTQFHHWGPVSPEVHAQLLEGYQSVRPLTPDEVAWWPVLVLWSTLVMVPPGEDPTGWGSAATTCASAPGLLDRARFPPSRS